MTYRPYITALVARLAGNEIGAKVVIKDSELAGLKGHLNVQHITLDGETATVLTLEPGPFEHRVIFRGDDG